MIAGKYYENNLGACTKLCVNAKAIKAAAEALMPYDPANTAAQKSMDDM